jgi:hypothetical protein
MASEHVGTGTTFPTTNCKSILKDGDDEVLVRRAVQVLQGEQIGRREEAEALILRQFSYKFGTLPAPLLSHIEQLSLEQLETLSVAWLSFESVADLEAWLQMADAQ